ncbi:piggyBac transposable element-derived protein 3-like [Neoarius graeffei]|uniref:piggyBac transposable element-derived protein 3-like n=1 Tax=Neoarius graeffei TaxID=443677 RepID=UPI00298CED42|nr:piggyBac transposable element-derived protein 3-like [Neoarius graeffei]
MFSFGFVCIVFFLLSYFIFCINTQLFHKWGPNGPQAFYMEFRLISLGTFYFCHLWLSGIHLLPINTSTAYILTTLKSIFTHQHTSYCANSKVRLPNCNLNDEKTLKKKGRGTFDVRVEENHNICAVTWYDTRQVTLVSSFTGPEPVEKVKRWDKTAKTFVEVQRPNIVATYNKNMGGVDLLDSFAAKYKFPLKSHRWYIYIFWHTIILAVINAWLLYKRDCKAWAIPKKEILIRRRFQAQLASSLILTGTSVPVPKRGRPSSSPMSSPAARPSKRRNAHPPSDVCKDMTGHFPHQS